MTGNLCFLRNPVRRYTPIFFALLGVIGCADSNGVRSAIPPAGEEMPPRPDTTISAAASDPQHRRLQALIGEWKAETKSWDHPGAPAKEGKGKVGNFWMLEGRFLGQEYKSKSQRPKYHGLGALGYDATLGAYTSVWLDSQSTSIETATGSSNSAGDVFTLEGTCAHSKTGKPLKCRSITHLINKHKYTFELFKEGADGKMFKTLDITYTR